MGPGWGNGHRGLDKLAREVMKKYYDRGARSSPNGGAVIGHYSIYKRAGDKSTEPWTSDPVNAQALGAVTPHLCQAAQIVPNLERKVLEGRAITTSTAAMKWDPAACLTRTFPGIGGFQACFRAGRA